MSTLRAVSVSIPDLDTVVVVVVVIAAAAAECSSIPDLGCDWSSTFSC